MRVYQFRHIRARGILAATAGQACCTATALPDRRHTHHEPRSRTPLRCRPLLPRLCLRLGRAPDGVRVGERAEQRGHRHARVAARRGPHGRERQGRARRDRPASRRASPPRSTTPSPAPRSAGATGSCSTAPPSSSRTARSAACGRSRACGRSTPARRTPSARSTAADVAKAAATWSTGLTNQGAGIKIAIIDDGVDQTHPYFAPAGYTMPAGFPKGQTAYTTAKVIVARAFAPAGIDVEVRAQAVRPGRSPGTRPTSPGSPPATPAPPRPAASRSPASRRGPTSATTRR